MKRIYVAGKYSDNNVVGILKNIRTGISYCAKILKKGHSPFCPWLDYQFSFFQDLSVKDYYRYSMAWLEVSDEIWVLPGYESSKGTLSEIKRAKELNIPIKYIK